MWRTNSRMRGWNLLLLVALLLYYSLNATAAPIRRKRQAIPKAEVLTTFLCITSTFIHSQSSGAIRYGIATSDESLPVVEQETDGETKSFGRSCTNFTNLCSDPKYAQAQFVCVNFTFGANMLSIDRTFASDADSTSPPTKRTRNDEEVSENVFCMPKTSDLGCANDEAAEGRQLSQGVKAMMGDDDDKKKRCFFDPPDSHRSNLEEGDRIETSRNGPCSGSLKKMESLMDDADGREVELYGAVHLLDLIIIRGTGEHNINWESEAVKMYYSNQYICENHARLLGFGFKDNRSPHVVRYRDLKQEGRLRGLRCGVPAKFGPTHPMNVKGQRQLSKEQTEALLHVHKVLIFPGTPTCRRHFEYTSELVAQHIVERKGYGICPLPDTNLAEAVPIDRGASQRGSPQRTPSQGGSSQGSLASQRSDYISGITRSQDSCNSDYKPIVSSTRPRIWDIYDQVGVTESMVDRLKDFGEAIGERRVASRLPFLDAEDDTKRKKVAAGRRLTAAMTRIMAPDASEQFLELVCRREMTTAETKLKKVLDDLVFNYKIAEGKQSRRMWLSIITQQLPYGFAAQYIPGLTEYAYYDAKRHYGLHRTSVPAPIKKTRYDTTQVECFVEFITSPYVTVGLPYGVVTTRMSDGTKIEIPSTLRQMSDGEVIDHYDKYLDDTDQAEMKMGHSSYRGILDALNANTRATLFCVDNIVAAAEDGMDRMLVLVKKSAEHGAVDDTVAASLRIKLFEIRGYLRTTYKMNVKRESQVATHCIKYALSDRTDSAFREPQETDVSTATHEHKYSCSLCQLMDETMADIGRILDSWLVDVAEKLEKAQANGNEMDAGVWADMKEKVSEWRDDFLTDQHSVYELRRHQLRAAHSEQTRVAIVDELREGDALVTIDFAQKLLPQKHRESQKEYFGKTGMSWHIAHVLTRDTDGRLKQHVFVHVFDTESQDSEMVTSILDHLFGHMHRLGLTRITLRSDNAACYKSQKTLLTIPELAAKNQVNVLRYSFSEVQAGKSAADRAAAKVKGHLRKYLRKGYDITSPDHFMGAVRYGARHLRGISFYRSTVTRAAATAIPRGVGIPGISKLGDFLFEQDGVVRVRRYASIGSGKTMSTTGWATAANQDSLVVSDQYLEPKAVSNFLSSAQSDVVNEPEDEGVSTATTTAAPDEGSCDAPPSAQARIPGTAYRCPTDGCIKTFSSYGNLVRHVVEGKHTFKPDRISLRDYSIGVYTRNLENLDEQRFVPLTDGLKESVLASPDNMPEEGWALSERRTVGRFTEDTVAFLIELYDEGVRKNKVTPAAAVRRMREARVDGKRRFERVLTADQIGSFFSRYGQKLRTEAQQSQPRARRSIPAADMQKLVEESNSYEGDDADEMDNDLYYESNFEIAMQMIHKHTNVELE